MYQMDTCTTTGNCSTCEIMISTSFCNCFSNHPHFRNDIFIDLRRVHMVFCMLFTTVVEFIRTYVHITKLDKAHNHPMIVTFYVWFLEHDTALSSGPLVSLFLVCSVMVICLIIFIIKLDRLIDPIIVYIKYDNEICDCYKVIVRTLLHIQRHPGTLDVFLCVQLGDYWWI